MGAIMIIRTKPTVQDTPTVRGAPDAGRGRPARKRSSARQARDRTMGSLEGPTSGRAAHAGEAYSDWDEAPLPLLLDPDFDHADDDAALAGAWRQRQAIRDEEDWAFC